MENWLMLTFVGKDRPGIVAKVSQVLFDMQGNLGEASMTRLGGNFTIMLMACIPESKTVVKKNFNKYVVSWVYFFIWTPLKQVCTKILNLMRILLTQLMRAAEPISKFCPTTVALTTRN